MVPQHVEYVAQQDERARRQAVQVLSVGHLQRLPQEPPEKGGRGVTFKGDLTAISSRRGTRGAMYPLSFTVAPLEEGEKSSDVEGGRSQTVGAGVWGTESYTHSKQNKRTDRKINTQMDLQKISTDLCLKRCVGRDSSKFFTLQESCDRD